MSKSKHYSINICAHPYYVLLAEAGGNQIFLLIDSLLMDSQVPADSRVQYHWKVDSDPRVPINSSNGNVIIDSCINYNLIGQRKN